MYRTACPRRFQNGDAMKTENSQDQTPFVRLLEAAVREPGKSHIAYSAFHGYSIGNQLLAMIQCAERGITPGPIGSFNKWKERGRHVQRGQRAIALWMPITVKRTIEQEGADPEQVAFTKFLLKRNWFTLSQTEGQHYTPEPIPNWDRHLALQTLGIQEIPVDHLDGNVWGFARGKQIAISPISPMPTRTMLHEIATLSSAIPPKASSRTAHARRATSGKLKRRGLPSSAPRRWGWTEPNTAVDIFSIGSMARRSRNAPVSGSSREQTPSSRLVGRSRWEVANEVRPLRTGVHLGPELRQPVAGTAAVCGGEGVGDPGGIR